MDSPPESESSSRNTAPRRDSSSFWLRLTDSYDRKISIDSRAVFKVEELYDQETEEISQIWVRIYYRVDSTERYDVVRGTVEELQQEIEHRKKNGA